MKLAIVTAFPPSKVTLNEYGYHLVKHFSQKEEIEEIVILSDEQSSAKDIDFDTAACDVHIHNCWKFNSYKNIFTVYKAIRDEKPDAILFNLQFMKFGDKKVAAALGLLLPMLCKIMGLPTIVLLHNILETVDLGNAGFTQNKILQKIYNFNGSLLTKLLLQADTVAVTISKYKEILETKYKKQNIQLIPHGAFELPPLPSFDLPEGPKKVMTFGKFGTYKKVEILIEAVELIRQRTAMDIEIVIAGTDSPNAAGYLAGVQKKYAHVPQLTFTGYVEEQEVPVIFGESAVVVFPYTSTTGSSGVLHQAGSYGKAVVLPDLGDLGILVREEGYRGEFFDPESTASFANAIEKIVANNAYRIELSKANYQAACSLPMETVTDMYVTAFHNIMEAKSPQEKALV